MSRAKNSGGRHGAQATPVVALPTPPPLNQRPGRNPPARDGAARDGVKGKPRGVSRKRCAPHLVDGALQPLCPGRTWASSGSEVSLPAPSAPSVTSAASPRTQLPGRPNALAPRAPFARAVSPGCSRPVASAARRAAGAALARSGCRDWERRRERARAGEDQEEEQERGQSVKSTGRLQPSGHHEPRTGWVG